jgi:hypothetical protein
MTPREVFRNFKSDFNLFLDIQPKVLAACIIAALVAVLLPRETVSRCGRESGILGSSLARWLA